MKVVAGTPYVVQVKGQYKTFSGYSDNKLEAKIYQGNFDNLSKKLQRKENLKEEDIIKLPFTASFGFEA